MNAFLKNRVPGAFASACPEIAYSKYAQQARAEKCRPFLPSSIEFFFFIKKTISWRKCI